MFNLSRTCSRCGQSTPVGGGASSASRGETDAGGEEQEAGPRWTDFLFEIAVTAATWGVAYIFMRGIVNKLSPTAAAEAEAK